MTADARESVAGGHDELVKAVATSSGAERVWWERCLLRRHQGLIADVVAGCRRFGLGEEAVRPVARRALLAAVDQYVEASGRDFDSFARSAVQLEVAHRLLCAQATRKGETASARSSKP